MIIDFNYPTLTAEGWRVKVHKTTLRGKTYIQSMPFVVITEPTTEVLK